MKYFTLSHQNPTSEAGYGRILENGTCEIVLKPGMCPLHKANKIQEFKSLTEVLNLDTIMGFRWVGNAPFNPKYNNNKEKGIMPENMIPKHWIFAQK